MKTIELKPSQTNAEETDNKNSSKIIENIEVFNTPFHAIKLDNGEQKANFIAWGANRLSAFMTDEEITDKVKQLERGETDWDIVGAMAACIAINIVTGKQIGRAHV